MLFAAACSSPHETPAPRRIESGLPAYPPHVTSLRLRRSVSVRLEPAGEAKRLGTVAQDTRVGYRSARLGPGCDRRWIEIEPRGLVCETNLEATTKQTIGVEL